MSRHRAVIPVVLALVLSTTSCSTTREAKSGLAAGGITFVLGAGTAGAVIKSGTWDQNQGLVGSGAFVAGIGLVVMLVSLVSWPNEPE